MPMTYDEFIDNAYSKSPDFAKSLYKSKDAFKESYIRSTGFSKWLDSLRDQDISVDLAVSIGATFIEHARRTPQEIKTILASISRQYNAELPVEPGLLTDDYWLSRFPAAAKSQNSDHLQSRDASFNGGADESAPGL